MAKQYFIWNNANPNEWVQITGQEFYALVNSESAHKLIFLPCPKNKDKEMDLSKIKGKHKL